MVFSCRRFSLCFEEDIDDETRATTNSTSCGTFYTAPSDFDGRSSTPNSQSALRIPISAERRSNLRLFTYAELKAATNNFAQSSMIGEGGFWSVYIGVIKSLEDPFNEITVAVKLGQREGLQELKQWVTEVNVLGKVKHPNLVKLVGYCAENYVSGIHRLLVYEYMPNRSLHDHLLAKTGAPLSWSMRLRVAVDAARGLVYLHEGMDFQIIFRDFKPSSILLDNQLNAKLSDFGYARLGPSEGHAHVSTEVVGKLGYVAPEYRLIGHLTTKCDVWSFGVFLYVLITGKPLFDPNNELLEWVRHHVSKSDFSLIIDSRIEGQFPLQLVQKLSNIANMCLRFSAGLRPKMSSVLAMLSELITEFLPETTPPLVPVEGASGVEFKAKRSIGCLARLCFSKSKNSS